MIGTIKRFSLLFIIFDVVLILVGFIFFDKIFILNTQVAFFSSVLITIGSFLGYRKNILNRVTNSDFSKMSENDRDKIDEIDDPYDLYSEEIKDDTLETKELSASEIKAILQEEKQRVKRNSFKNMVFSTSGFASIYRIAGYLFLIIGFFSLNNHQVFNAVAYLVGLSIVPIGAAFSNFILKQEVNQ